MRRAVTFALLLSAGAAWAGGLGALELAEEPVSLLAGRLEVRLPAGAKVEARGHSLMAAPEAVERETRVVLDVGEQRVVLMAWELFASKDDGFEAAVKAEAQGAKIAAFAPAEGLAGWKVDPEKLDTTEEAIDVGRVAVADAAGLVIAVAVYVNPPAAKDEAGSRALAGKVLASLRPGARKLDLAARDAVLEELPGGERLLVPLPAGWVHYPQEGPDFVVHHLSKVVPLGQRGPRVGVYLGHHPGWLHERKEDAKVEVVPVTLLGEKTAWKRWAPEAGRTVLETILPVGEGRAAHVFVDAPDADLEAGRKVAEALARKKKS